MKLILAVVLLLLALPVAAAEAHPDLLQLEQELTAQQDDKKESRITPEEYGEWEIGFRSRLEIAEAGAPPSPENTAARARIAALLGERERAGASLDQALEGDPESPILLRTKGQLLYESKDYPGAAEHGLQAWEKSGRTDMAAFALYQTSKGRGAPTGGSSVASLDGSAATQGSPVAPAADSSLPYRLPVRGGAGISEVPSVTADAVPTEGNANGLGLLTTLGIGAGVLLIAWGAVPQETKDHFKQVLWEQPKKEVKVVAAATAIIGSVYLGVTFLPAMLATAGPSAPALTPALAGGGAAGGGVVLQQAVVGTAKAGILAGGATIALNKAADHVSYVKSNSSGQSPDESIEPTKHGTERLSDLNPTRGGVLSTKEAMELKQAGRVLNQRGGGKVYMKEVEPGKYNVFVENAEGRPITSFRHIRLNKLQNLARNYGWF